MRWAGTLIETVRPASSVISMVSGCGALLPQPASTRRNADAAAEVKKGGNRIVVSSDWMSARYNGLQFALYVDALD
jgi:hypothetical protein